MRVLVISHAAVIPANQVLYCEMERLPDIELALVVPQSWRASIGGNTSFVRHEKLTCSVIERPVWLEGHINLHFYRGLEPELLPFTPDIIYADEDPYSLAAYQALRLARRLDAALVFKSNQNILKKYPPPFSWTESAVMGYASGVIAIAEACAEVLRAKGCRCLIEVIGHGIDPKVFHPRDASDLRQRLGIERFAVGYMGRLSSEKGCMDLVEACKMLVDGGQREFTLVFIGDGPQRPDLEAAARSLQGVRVIFAGAVPHGEAAEYLNCLDTLVLPSRTTARWREQFGRVIIEALACGVAVIGSDSGNIPILIRETGGGRVFPEGDICALAHTLGGLIADPAAAREMGQAGREVVLERYTYSTIARRIAQALRTATETRKSE